MDFDYSADQIEMRDSVARIFTDLCDDASLKKLSAQDCFFHATLWQQLAETGIFGLPFAEQYGGLELGLVDLCNIIELQGAAVAPVPLIPSVVEAGMTIASCNNEELKSRILPAIIGGSICTPVRAYSGLQQAAPLTVDVDGDEISINGRSGFVPYAALAKGFVVETTTQDNEAVLIYCESDSEGINIVEQIAITDEPAGFIEFDNVNVSASSILAMGDEAVQLALRQKQRCYIALGALQLGCLEEGLKRTAAYVSERKQFGRALGSFQAVSQQAADAFMEIESLRSVYWRSLDHVEQGASLAISAPVVKYWVAEAGHKAAHTEMHLHGGIGQDLDYPIHRYFLLAKHCERYLGSPAEMASAIGAELMQMNADELENRCL